MTASSAPLRLGVSLSNEAPVQETVDLVRLAKCDPQTLCAEAAAAGFDALDPRVIEPTREHAGSEIVCLGVPA